MPVETVDDAMSHQVLPSSEFWIFTVIVEVAGIVTCITFGHGVEDNPRQIRAIIPAPFLGKRALNIERKFFSRSMYIQPT